MATTPNLKLTYVEAAQSQKHVPVNENSIELDSVVQCAVKGIYEETPPGSPTEGDRYITGETPTGAWAGKDYKLAVYIDGVWRFFSPVKGWMVYNLDNDKIYCLDSTGAWEPVSGIPDSGAVIQNASLVGIGTTADGSNPFSARLNAALWTALYAADGGNGDLFYTMNKELATDDLGLTLQQNFVTKALMGLFGSNKFRLAVSDDGSSFFNAFEVDNTNGIVDLPNLTRFIAYINYDQYIGANTWTQVPFNDTTNGYNDQNAYDAGNKRFVAPVAGIYAFGASLGWKQNNTNVPTLTKGKFVKNGGGTPVDLSAPLVSIRLADLATAGTEIALNLSTMVELAAGDTVEVQQIFTGLDGYIPSTISRFWGAKVG